MIKKMPRNIQTKDISEFTDEQGKKWVPTSTADLFSMKEFSDIMKSVEQDKEPGDIVQVHIDVQKVNKEYYEAAVALQEKVNRQAELLKQITVEVNASMEKKNNKLLELMTYIRNLHQFISYINNNVSDSERIKFQFPTALPEVGGEIAGRMPAYAEKTIKASVYQDVTEEELELKNI